MIARRRSDSMKFDDDGKHLPDKSSPAEQAKVHASCQNDANNNLFLDKSQSRRRDREASRLKQQRSVSGSYDKPVPSYVPSYIRNVSFECNHTKRLNFARQNRSLSQLSELPHHKIHRAHSTNCSSSKPRRRLRSRLSEPSEPVNVRDAVAVMEARINSTPTERITKVTRSNPVKVTSGANDLAAPKEEHARSMSDSSDSQISFKQMKEMWNQKAVELKQQLPLNESNARSGGSSSSINSVGSVQSVEKQVIVKNETLSKKPDAPAVTTKPQGRLIANRPPAVAPRPKNHRLRPRAVTVSQLPVSKTVPGTATTERSPSPIELLSVSEKALLFGGTKRRSVPREEKKRDDDETPEDNCRRSSWSDEKQRKASMDKEQAFLEDSPYFQVPKEGKVMDIFKKTRERRAKLEEQERLVEDLSKNAKLAKERRRTRTSTGSSNISTPSDDEERGRIDLFIPGVRRRSKDSGPSTPKEEAHVAILKTENSIFGSSPINSDSSRYAADEAEFKSRRRASSLQKLLENKFYDSAVPLNSHSPVENKPVERSEIILPSVAEGEVVAIVQRPNKLFLNRRERSNTADALDLKKSIKLSNVKEKSKSTDKLNLVSKPSPTPTTPDNRSSGFCEEEDSDASKIPPIQSPSKNSVFSVTEVDKERSDSKSSLPESILPGLGEFNLLEEYDKIAKQLNEEKGHDFGNSKPISDNSSTRSIDSGVQAETMPNINDWSDSTDNSSDEENSIPDTPSEQPLEILPSPTVSLKEPNEVKLHNIAKELLSTEESYVAVLRLIDQVFHKQIQEAAAQKNIMPKQVVDKIFSHVPAIYSFHSSFLLPQLKERLQNWETNPRIGDIMTKAAPFLKMYSLYVQQFDETMNLIKQWSEKSNGFNSIIQAIQKTPECNFLTLQHHMLGPVQRVPRYRLLLEDYVKKLPEDAVDRQEAEMALCLITKAATHSNETMKKIEKFHKLVSIFNNLADIQIDLMDVTRELLKEGKIIKISARNGEKYERYLYLFSDMLLCCTPQRRLGNKAYKVTAKIDLDGMKVSQVRNNSVPFAFIVNGLQKSMEFATNVEEDRDKWIQAIQEAIDERKDRQQTFKSFKAEQTPGEDANGQNLAAPARTSPQLSPMHHSKSIPRIEMTDDEIGTRAPRWIKDHETPACMCCFKSFNKLLRRRHHCRACGGVICSECSENKAMLPYDMSKPMKVCTKCLSILNGRRRSATLETTKKSGVLEVGAGTVSEKSILASYLFYCENVKKKHWVETWCVIPQNELCLYFYGAHQDVRAQMTLPLPGFEVTDVESSEHRFVFRLHQARKTMFFGCDDKLTVEKWKYAIGQASKGYDLDKDDVKRLGRPISACSSDEVQEEDDEEEVEDQFEPELNSPLALPVDKFIDDEDDPSDHLRLNQDDNPSPEEEKTTEMNVETCENVLSSENTS